MAKTDKRYEGAAMSSTVAAMAFGAMALGGAPAEASLSPQERSGVVMVYDIPAGAVATALNAFALKNGLHLLYEARVTRALRTPGLAGAYSLREGLDRLLAGTGLAYRFGGPDGKAVSIILAQNDGLRSDAGAEALPTIDVGARESRDDRSGAGGKPIGPGDRYTGYKAESAASAMKMDLPLMKTPVAVQVVTRQTMDDQQAISVGDAIVTNVSGVQTTPNFYEAYKIRGFSNTASTYKNGLIEYRMRNLDTANLQSIEVLKGPAAILYGRVEPGGLIDLVVKRPLETPYYSVQQQIGSYSLTRTTVDATGPLLEDKSLLYRFNGEFYRSNSYRDFVNDQNVFLAPTLSFHPIEQFRMNVDFEYQHRTYVSDYPSLPVVGGYPANIPISRYLQTPLITTSAPVEFDKKRIAYDWTYSFDKDWSVTNRLSYMYSTDKTTTTFALGFNQVTGDLTRTLTNTSNFGGSSEIDFATNVDLKGRFETGPLTHATLFGFDRTTTRMPLYDSSQKMVSAINIYSPNYWTLDNAIGTPTYVKQAQDWTGIYGQDLISYDDKVHLLLGGRYDWAETSGNTNRSSALAAAASYTTVYNKAFSPRVGLVYQPMPWLSLYGNFTRSFGANNQTTLGLALPPQKGEQFEGGVKAELLDKRIMATFAYFDLTKTNVPTPDPNDASNSLVIGKARSQGVEIDVTGRIDDNWSVIANYTHDDVRTVQGALVYNPATLITTQLAVSGYKLPASPRNYGNFWVKYDADGMFRGLSLGAGVTVVESSLGDNANSFILPGYTLLNGMLSYTTQIEGLTVTAQLNVKNITDTIYYPSSNNRVSIMTGTPRTVLGSLRIEF